MFDFICHQCKLVMSELYSSEYSSEFICEKCHNIKWKIIKKRFLYGQTTFNFASTLPLIINIRSIDLDVGPVAKLNLLDNTFSILKNFEIISSDVVLNIEDCHKIITNYFKLLTIS